MSLATAAAILMFSAPANAALYDLTFVGTDVGLNDNFDVTATFTTDAANDLLSISGTVTSESLGTAGYDGAITGLVTQSGTPPGLGTYTSPTTGQQWNYDDVYQPSNNPSFDNGGILFKFGAGNYGNLYSVPGGPGSTSYYFSVDAPPTVYNPGDGGAVSVTGSVPEFATWEMLLGGFAGLGLAGYRRGRRRLDPLNVA